MSKDVNPKIKCSFCDKPQQAVFLLVGGPGGVCICNECIEVGTLIMMNKGYEFQGLRRHLKDLDKNTDGK